MIELATILDAQAKGKLGRENNNKLLKLRGKGNEEKSPPPSPSFFYPQFSFCLHIQYGS